MISTMTLWYAMNDAGVPDSVIRWARDRWPNHIRVGLMLYEQDLTTIVDPTQRTYDDFVVQQRFIGLPYPTSDFSAVCIDIEMQGFLWSTLTAPTQDKLAPFKRFINRIVHEVRILMRPSDALIGWYGTPTWIDANDFGIVGIVANRYYNQYTMWSMVADAVMPSLYWDDRLTASEQVARNNGMLLRDREPSRTHPLGRRTIPILGRWPVHSETNAPIDLNDLLESQLVPCRRNGIAHISLWDSNNWPVHGTNTADARCRETIEAIAENLGWSS